MNFEDMAQEYLQIRRIIGAIPIIIILLSVGMINLH